MASEICAGNISANPNPNPNRDPRNLSLIPYVPSIADQLRSALEAKNGNHETEEERKRDKEHKKRSKNWTRQETLMLIRLRTHLAPSFAMAGRKSELWDFIAEGMQKERFSRDAQQCKDKWEKLMVGYKEVRQGLKEKEDNPFFDELHPLLSRRNAPDTEAFQQAPTSNTAVKDEKDEPSKNNFRDSAAAEEIRASEDRSSPSRKRKRESMFVSGTNLHVVQTLLETILSRQQHCFKTMLEAMEQRELVREQRRLEREEKWRAEERAQQCVFNNAMLVLAQTLVGERVGVAQSMFSGSLVGSPGGQQGLNKRSKNWKRAEVCQLIKLRGEMDQKFATSARKTGLWDELAELLQAEGIKRDGKQCREKWDKLMCEYKDVIDGKRDQGDSPYFGELMAILGRRSEEAG